MRLFLLSLSLFGTSSTAFSAYQQQLIPIVRDIKTSSAPSVTEWKTFVQMANYAGTSYVALVQVAELLHGHLRWYPVSKNVDLSVHNKTIRFPYDSSRVWIEGRRHRLERASVKNEDGFWVPVSFFASPAFYRATQSKMVWPPIKPVQRREHISLPSSPDVSGAPASNQRLAAGTAPSPRRSSVDGGSQHVWPAETNDEKRVSVARSDRKAIHRIVIDPGHGGKDPGAEGAHGTEEKAINLQLAQELAEVLRQDHDYEVLLTRMDDTFIPLDQRAKLANTYNADLFISIHCNASLSSKLKGFEVYFLSESASDPHADAVARLENAPLLLEGKPVPSTSQVARVLRSLVKTANINEASALGSLVDRHLAEKLLEPSLGVKQAAFYVLRGAEMPAILIETGFISNTQEERLLQDYSFRKKVIEGLAAGIAAFDERKQKERR